MGNITFKDIEDFFIILLRPKSSNYENNATIEILNDDCLLQIFQHLSIVDRMKLEKVSRRWKSLSRASWGSFKVLDFIPTTWGQAYYEIYNMKSRTFKKVLKLSGKYITTVNFHILCKYNCSKYFRTQAAIDILKYCPNIRELLILNVEPMDEKDSEILMKLLISTGHNIRKFGLRFFPSNYTDEDLATLFGRMVNLKHISLDRISGKFQGNCLLSLPADIEQINFQQISSSFRNIEALQSLISTAENLKTLGFSETKNMNFDPLLDSLKLRANSLTKLILRYCRWKPYDPNLLFSTISELVNLETIDVKWSSFVDDDFLKVVAMHCKKLKDLRIDNCNSVTDVGITRISELKQLNCLIISHLSHIVSPELKNLENLKVLDCSFTKRLQEDAIVPLIHAANNLEVLNVSGCPNVSNNLIKEILLRSMKRKYVKTLNISIKDTKINYSKISKYHNSCNVILKDTFTFF